MYVSVQTNLCVMYTQYIKKRNTYIFADYLSNFKDVQFKLTGYIDEYIYQLLAQFHNFPGTVTPCFLSSNKGTHRTKSRNQYAISKRRFFDVQTNHVHIFPSSDLSSLS